MVKKTHYLRNTLFVVLAILIIPIVIGITHEKYVDSLSVDDKFIRELKKNKDDSLQELESINSFWVFYIENDWTVGYRDDYFNDKELKLIKDSYSNALEDLYFSGDYNSEYYSLQGVINDINSSKLYGDYLGKFEDIKKELLNPDLEEKLYTDEILSALEKVEELKIARDKKEEENREIENFEREVHFYMKDAFNKITNYGDTYDPDIHDKLINNLASEKYNITPNEAQEIFIRYEMK